MDRIDITIPAGIAMVSLVGPNDSYMKILESAFPNIAITVRGNEIHASGAQPELKRFQEIISEFLILLRGGQVLSEDTVLRSLAMFNNDPQYHPAEVLSLNILSNRGKTIRPKTANQKRYVEAIDSNTITFGIGPAGTGKTYLAMAKAVQALQSKQINRIILTRPAVEAGERLGFLPGTLQEKIDPYLRPLFDALHDMIDQESIPRLITNGIIEIAPLAYMRGRTLNDAFIILDEAQNTSAEQMKMFLTRLGFGSKMVVTGDATQIDLPNGVQSGIKVVHEILEDVADIAFIELAAEDVVRNRLVGDIVTAYQKFEDGKSAPHPLRSRGDR
jgi:phosphate starvation-inducible protein PhoH and related proteins